MPAKQAVAVPETESVVADPEVGEVSLETLCGVVLNLGIPPQELTLNIQSILVGSDITPYVTSFDFVDCETNEVVSPQRPILEGASKRALRQVPRDYTYATAMEHYERFVTLFASPHADAAPIRICHPTSVGATVADEFLYVPLSDEFANKISPLTLAMNPTAVMSLGGSGVAVNDVAISAPTQWQAPQDGAAAVATAVAAEERLSAMMSTVPLVVRDVGLAAANPLPVRRRRDGDLFEVAVTTLEGTTTTIVATVSGFRTTRAVPVGVVASSVAKKAAKGAAAAAAPAAAAPTTTSKMFATLVGAVIELSPAARPAFEDVLRIRSRLPAEVSTRAWGAPPSAWTTIGTSTGATAVPRELDGAALLSWEKATYAATSRTTLRDGSAGDRSRNVGEAFAAAAGPQAAAEMKSQLAARAHETFVESVNAILPRIARGEIVESTPGEPYFVVEGVFYSVVNTGAVPIPYVPLETALANAKADLRVLPDVAAVVNSAAIGVNPIPTAVADYRGNRIVGQVPIQGLLQGYDTHVYGLEESPDPAVGSLRFDATKRADFDRLGEVLFCKPHTVRCAAESAAADGVAADAAAAKLAPWDASVSGYPLSEAVTVTLSAEVRGSVGTDGRVFLLELAATGPRDVNFLHLPAARFRAGILSRFIRSAGPDAPKSWNPDLYSSVLVNVDAADGGASVLADDAKDLEAVANWVKDDFLSTVALSLLRRKVGTFIGAVGQPAGEVLQQLGVGSRYLGFLAAEAAAVAQFPWLWLRAVRFFSERTAAALTAAREAALAGAAPDADLPVPRASQYSARFLVAKYGTTLAKTMNDRSAIEGVDVGGLVAAATELVKAAETEMVRRSSKRLLRAALRAAPEAAHAAVTAAVLNATIFGGEFATSAAAGSAAGASADGASLAAAAADATAASAQASFVKDAALLERIRAAVLASAAEKYRYTFSEKDGAALFPSSSTGQAAALRAAAKAVGVVIESPAAVLGRRGVECSDVADFVPIIRFAEPPFADVAETRALFYGMDSDPLQHATALLHCLNVLPQYSAVVNDHQGAVSAEALWVANTSLDINKIQEVPGQAQDAARAFIVAARLHGPDSLPAIATLFRLAIETHRDAPTRPTEAEADAAYVAAAALIRTAVELLSVHQIEGGHSAAVMEALTFAMMRDAKLPEATEERIPAIIESLAEVEKRNLVFRDGLGSQSPSLREELLYTEVVRKMLAVPPRVFIVERVAAVAAAILAQAEASESIEAAGPSVDAVSAIEEKTAVASTAPPAPVPTAKVAAPSSGSKKAAKRKK